MRKPKYLKLTTPKGTAVYPWLTEPNRKFDPVGVYSVNLRMTADEAETFIKKITEVRDKYHKSQTKELNKKLKKAELPIIEVVDDQGNETGEIELKCKLKARYEHNGKTITQRPLLIDTNQDKVSGEIRIGSGTTMRVGVDVCPYNMSTNGVGVTLRLRAVQIIDLVEFGSGVSGFDFKDEEGFETISANLSDTHEDDDLEGMM